jgi:hypothetical protein
MEICYKQHIFHVISFEWRRKNLTAGPEMHRFILTPEENIFDGFFCQAAANAHSIWQGIPVGTGKPRQVMKP